MVGSVSGSGELGFRAAEQARRSMEAGGPRQAAPARQEAVPSGDAASAAAESRTDSEAPGRLGVLAQGTSVDIAGARPPAAGPFKSAGSASKGMRSPQEFKSQLGAARDKPSRTGSQASARPQQEATGEAQKLSETKSQDVDNGLLLEGYELEFKQTSRGIKDYDDKIKKAKDPDQRESWISHRKDFIQDKMTKYGKEIGRLKDTLENDKDLTENDKKDIAEAIRRLEKQVDKLHNLLDKY